MADTKISALTAATTPLAGTEVLPIVQSGVTKKVAVSDLTAGRAITAANLDGAIIGATTPAAGSFTTVNVTQYASGDTLVMGTTSYSGAFATTRFAHYINAIDTDYISAYNIGGGNNVGMMQLFANAGRSGTPGTVKLAIGLDAPGGAAITAAIGTASNHPLSFGVNSAEVARFDTSGNLVPKTAAKGVNFTANTPAAGMTSQLLNWYEEGTFTPTLNATGFSGATYSTQVGRYTRIGRQVTVQAHVALSALTSGGSNYLRIEGLPFTSASGVQSTGGTVYSENLTGGSSGNYLVSIIAGGQSAINFFEIGPDGNTNGNGMQGSRLTATSAFIVTATYIV